MEKCEASTFSDAGSIPAEGTNMPTMSETSLDKRVVMNGQVMPGVHKVSIEYGVEKPVVVVTLTMQIKRGSLSVEGNTVSFDTVSVPK